MSSVNAQMVAQNVSYVASDPVVTMALKCVFVVPWRID